MLRICLLLVASRVASARRRLATAWYPRSAAGAGKKTGPVKALAGWPRLLRAVRAWLTPAYWLARCLAAFADTPPPAELGALNTGHGINLYLRV